MKANEVTKIAKKVFEKSVYFRLQYAFPLFPPRRRCWRGNAAFWFLLLLTRKPRPSDRDHGNPASTERS